MAALTPRPRLANAFQRIHLLAPPNRLTSAWIQASRAVKTGKGVEKNSGKNLNLYSSSESVNYKYRFHVCVDLCRAFCSRRARKGRMPRESQEKTKQKCPKNITRMASGLLLWERSMPFDPRMYLVEQRLKLRMNGLVLIPPRGCDYTFSGTRHMQSG